MEKVKDTPLDRRLYRGSISTVRARIEEHVQWVASTVARRPGPALGTFPEPAKVQHTCCRATTLSTSSESTEVRTGFLVPAGRGTGMSRNVSSLAQEHRTHFITGRRVPSRNGISRRTGRIHLPRSGRFVGLDNTARAREWPVDRPSRTMPSRTMPTRTMPTRSCRPGRSRTQDAGTGRRRPRAGPVVAGSRPVRTHPGAAAARASRRVVGCTGGPRYSSARRIRLVAYGARLECVLG